jgi:hypothetical protein
MLRICCMASRTQFHNRISPRERFDRSNSSWPTRLVHTANMIIRVRYTYCYARGATDDRYVPNTSHAHPHPYSSLSVFEHVFHARAYRSAVCCCYDNIIMIISVVERGIKYTPHYTLYVIMYRKEG